MLLIPPSRWTPPLRLLKTSRMKPRFSPPHGTQNKQARENRHVQTVETAVPSLDEDDVLAIVAEQAVPFVLILDCVQDPHNLGAILRTADAAGVHVVVAPKDKAVGITETVRRVSVGAADHVPFAQVTNLARTMEKLKAAGLWLVGVAMLFPLGVFIFSRSFVADAAAASAMGKKKRVNDVRVAEVRGGVMRSVVR